MPIITTQRRMTEQGRIRLGHKVTGTSKTGREFTRPAKLERFRFTSASQRLIEEIAATYGGDARPWDNDGKAEFEVLSEATSIPVIVVKGGFSQWHEFWTKGGCQHRCDGEKDVTGTLCDPQDPAHLAAIEKPTTRLSVMLSEIESLGVWRMESKGWNAAAELPSMAELAMHVGDLVPATLGLAERSSIVQTEKGPQTSRYVVPFLDLHVTKQRLVEIVGGPGGAPALEAAPPAALEAAPGDAPRLPTLVDVEAADTEQAVYNIFNYLTANGGMTPELDAACKARVAELREEAQTEGVSESGGTPATPSTSDEEGVVDAEIVDDTEPDPDRVWSQIMQIAASRGLATTADLEQDCELFLGGTNAGEASGAELALYLEDLTGRPEVAA